MWGGIFHFYSNSNRTFYKQIVKTLIGRRYSAASGLGQHYLPMSHKKDVMLIWVQLQHGINSLTLQASDDFVFRFFNNSIGSK